MPCFHFAGPGYFMRLVLGAHRYISGRMLSSVMREKYCAVEFELR
jgi:hypothetical protein